YSCRVGIDILLPSVHFVFSKYRIDKEVDYLIFKLARLVYCSVIPQISTDAPHRPPPRKSI
ncbi:hypothetical protein, partial [Chromobacterium phragmitis]|uniref:hypothetical protein n=1 Tax=Chromobacterium phragmitis TaxID=2202141 RepID=UPI003264A645